MSTRKRNSESNPFFLLEEHLYFCVKIYDNEVKKDYFELREKTESLVLLRIELPVLGTFMHKESGPLRKRKFSLKTTQE